MAWGSNGSVNTDGPGESIEEEEKNESSVVGVNPGTVSNQPDNENIGGTGDDTQTEK